MCCPDLTENEAHLHILTVLETMAACCTVTMMTIMHMSCYEGAKIWCNNFSSTSLVSSIKSLVHHRSCIQYFNCIGYLLLRNALHLKIWPLDTNDSKPPNCVLSYTHEGLNQRDIEIQWLAAYLLPFCATTNLIVLAELEILLCLINYITCWI